jgi:hypothetical protein
MPYLKNFEPDPLTWLRKEWLPVAQRGEYRLAALMPWLYLGLILGDTRLAILTKEIEATDSLNADNGPVKDCFFYLELIYRIYRLSTLLPFSGSNYKFETSVSPVDSLNAEVALCADKERTINREIAIASGLALVNLIFIWAREQAGL